jgi:predicted unusual protein kinase regulating ubiquinone biosynthesis (AarF/ABC1/UbiB family)
VKLLVAAAPLVALYPLQRLTRQKEAPAGAQADAHATFLASLGDTQDLRTGWYLRLCLRSVERSGAAVIKLMQWASSRPDLFGKEFCRAFAKLQDDTTPHALRHTEAALRRAHGEDWEERIRLDPRVVGSGCIGQVYKGTIKDLDGREQQVRNRNGCRSSCSHVQESLVF